MAEPARPEDLGPREAVSAPAGVEPRLSQVFSIVLSVFGLVGIGYAVARVGLLSVAAGSALSDFVFTVAIPCLLFGTLAAADMHGVSPWRIWAAYFAAFAIVWALGHLTMRRLFGRDVRAGVVGGVSAAYTNAVLIGVPLMQAAFGGAGTVFLIIIVSVHLPIMMLTSVILNEWALDADGVAQGDGGRREAIRRALRSILRHPILIGIVAGGVWRMTGLGVPAIVTGIIDPLGRSAGPLALFASGMALVGYGMGRQIGPALALAALKLLLLPALVFAAARVAGLQPLAVAVLTLTAACPTGVNAYLVATRFGTGEALASNTILFSTAGGVVTVTLWLAVLRATL